MSRATEAAEQLFADAAGSAASRLADKPPSAGWQAPADRQNNDVELLAGIVRSLRELVPPELQQRLAEALRELLVALRALIDWYLERGAHNRREPTEVQDIPIL